MNKQDRLNKRPFVINLAVIFLYFSLAIGVIGYFITSGPFKQLQSGIGPIKMVIPFVIALAVNIWFFYKIAVGRNWARVLVLIFYTINITFYISQITNTFSSSLILGVLGALACVIQLAVLYLLFLTKDGVNWFKKKAT